MIDIHNHILPCLDDGANSFDESLELIQSAYFYGVKEIILTPHFMFGTDYQASNKEKKESFEVLVNLVKEKNIPVNLYLGNEVFIESNLVDFLHQDKIMPLANSQYLLFELPRFDVFHGVLDEIFSLESQGIIPILAHPERYKIIMDNPNAALQFKERGVLFQANLGSFVGIYGKKIQEMACLLLKHHCIELIASDVHHQKHCHYKRIEEVKRILKKYISEEEITMLLENNPKKIIMHEKIDVLEPAPFKKNLFGKWK